jgi:hypothetical protein
MHTLLDVILCRRRNLQTDVRCSCTNQCGHLVHVGLIGMLVRLLIRRCEQSAEVNPPETRQGEQARQIVQRELLAVEEDVLHRGRQLQRRRRAPHIERGLLMTVEAFELQELRSEADQREVAGLHAASPGQSGLGGECQMADGREQRQITLQPWWTSQTVQDEMIDA